MARAAKPRAAKSEAGAQRSSTGRAGVRASGRRHAPAVHRSGSTTPDAPLLRCAGVTKDYGSTRALGPISLELHDGEAVALVGHNGSGKSTLLSLVAGMIEPTEGTIEVRGTPAGERKARSVVSYLPDNPVLYDDLSLREHLDYLSRLHGTTPEAQHTDNLLEAFALTSRVDDLPADFSRGLKQKAAITIGVCRPYGLLLLDEPFSGLDRLGRLALIELIGQIRAAGGSVLVSTHDEQAMAVFDRIITLEQGALVDDVQQASASR